MLSPRRALLHPAWLVALVVLGLNDHVFKAAHVLPGFVTGKLSDFAGLFVAPALLCVIGRARSQRGVLAAHVATAMAFALVKTIPFATHLFEHALSLVVSSRVWTDPTDLVALPMVLAAHRVLVPRMQSALPEGWGSRLATLVGSVMCVATSSPAEPSLTIHNGSKHTLQITMRSTSARFENDAIRSSTPLPLDEKLFDGAPSTVTAKADEKVTPPNAALGSLTLVALDDPTSNVHERFAAVDVGGEIEIAELPSGRLTLQGAAALFVRDLSVAALCAKKPAAKVYSMSLPDVPYGEYTITSSAPTMDGCLEIGFQETSKLGKVCLPAGAWPFAVGEHLSGDSTSIAHDDASGTRTVVTVAFHLAEALVPDKTCAMVDACNAIAFDAAMKLSDGALLRAGEEHTLTNGNRTEHYWAAAMDHAVLTVEACVDAFVDLGDHANTVVVSTSAAPPPYDAGTD